METLEITTISFPELNLSPRDAPKLRGFFGNQHPDKLLLHNHRQEGGFRMAYPLVQYKILQGQPTIVGIQQGATLLQDIFRQTHHVIIDAQKLPLNEKRIATYQKPLGPTETLQHYRFITPWLALNQHNYQRYQELETPEHQHRFLQKTLISNLLSMCKGLGIWIQTQIQAQLQLQDSLNVRFKDQNMLAFRASFQANMQLPPLLGLGKQSARGFGAFIPVPKD